jgi:hypothetical protein
MVRSIFNSHVTIGKPRNLFDAVSYSFYAASAPIQYETIVTPNQLTTLQTVYNSYVTMLASRSYEKIPSNYPQFLRLLRIIKNIHIDDYRLQMLIYIAENALVGSINANTLYQRYAYDEIKLALLNKRIQEILSDKNTITTTASTTGQFNATVTFKLAPIFSYYVYVYGMPEYGVGFDPDKLAFLRSLPIFNVANAPDNDPIACNPIIELPGTTPPTVKPCRK